MTNLQALLIGFLAFSLLGNAVEFWRISSLDDSVAQLSAQRDEAISANQSLSASIKLQNKKIAELAAEGLAKDKKAQAAADKATKLEKQLLGKSAERLEKIRPTGNACKDTFTMLDTYFGKKK